MDSLMNLWLPSVLSGVAVFFASFITWALLPFHNKEYKAIPGEEEFMKALRQYSVPAGDYMLPYAGCNSEKMKDPAFREMMKTSPMGHMRVWQGAPSMARNMILTVIVLQIISAFVAYLTSQTVMPGADMWRVFQISTTAAFMAHAFGGMCNAIWFGKSIRGFILDLIDSTAYALITGAIFTWLWPSAATIAPTLGT